MFYFSLCGTLSGIAEFVLFFLRFRGTRFDHVQFCGLFFCVWNILWYCGILCYIFLGVECAPVLWKVHNVFPAYGMCSGIVGFCVIFFYVCNALWYCQHSCYILLHLERAEVMLNFV